MEPTIAPTRAAPPRETRRDLRPDLLWLGALAILLVLDARTIAGLPVHHDIAYPLYAAREMLAGKRLYVDIVQIHPPLVFWWATLAELVSRLVGVSDIAVYHFFSLVAVAGSTTLNAVLLRRLLPHSAWTRSALLAVQAFLLLPFVGYSLGQEEHLMLALTWPYLLAAALAARGRDTGRWGSWVGCMAAVGFAMKPPYALTWLAVEAYIALSQRRFRWRRETILVAAGLVAYGLAMVVFTPALFRMIIWGAGSYANYLDRPLLVVVLVPQTYLVLCGALAAVLPRDPETGALRHVAAIAVIPSSLIVYAQLKGWSYHWYPAVALALYLIALAAVGLLRARHPGQAGEGAAGTPDREGEQVGRRGLRGLRSPALWTSVLLLALVGTGDYMLAGTRRLYRDLRLPPYHLPAMRYFVQAFGRGGPIMVISDIMQPAFPLVNYEGVSLASRFPCLWMLPGLYVRERGAAVPFPYHDPSNMAPLERYMINAVVEDMQRARPTLLIMDLEPPYLLPAFDYAAYFTRDPRFRELMSHYERVVRYHRYLIWRRVR